MKKERRKASRRNAGSRPKLGRLNKNGAGAMNEKETEAYIDAKNRILWAFFNEEKKK